MNPLDILVDVAISSEFSGPLPPRRPAPPTPLAPARAPHHLPPHVRHPHHAALLAAAAPQQRAAHAQPLRASVGRGLHAPTVGGPAPAVAIPIPVPRGVVPGAYMGTPPGRGSRGSPGSSGSGRTRRGRRDCYTRFTTEEEVMLLDGVSTFGAGNWKRILQHYPFHWKRTAVDLKDKYRNIMRARSRRAAALAASGDEASSPSSAASDVDGSPRYRGVGVGRSPLSAPPVTAHRAQMAYLLHASGHRGVEEPRRM